MRIQMCTHQELDRRARRIAEFDRLASQVIGKEIIIMDDKKLVIEHLTHTGEFVLYSLQCIFTFSDRTQENGLYYHHPPSCKLFCKAKLLFENELSNMIKTELN